MQVLESVLCLLLAAGGTLAQGQEPKPPEFELGKRLFLETRFAQFFFAHHTGINEELPFGDPVVETILTTTGTLPGPFAGQSINCRHCHLVEELVGHPDGGMRAYSDFARRSPLPDRGDGMLASVRNSQPLVNAALPREGGLIVHWDGEFASLFDLVDFTLTGRNFGWLLGERATALAHVAEVIRGDDGSGELAAQFGELSYTTVFSGTDPSIPPRYLLPPELRVDVAQATDLQILDGVVTLLAIYTEDLVFARDGDGLPHLSPYHVFLETNGLPREPGAGEAPLDYSRRLLSLVEALGREGALEFVTQNPNTPDGRFRFHDQRFRFGPRELFGLRIFFSEQEAQGAIEGVGNCLLCHPAPHFTDFSFHNTGVTQIEYDSVHGPGAFLGLFIPEWTERSANHDLYLPPTESHPRATGIFRRPADPAEPGASDLGLWNVFGNPDFLAPQGRLKELLIAQDPGGPKRFEELLPRAVASFKTPSLRDLGHSGPYMHNGELDTLEDVVNHYHTAGGLARTNALRNPDAALVGIGLSAADVDFVADFLRALNEDFE